MKERPILFSGSMVRAILDGRKSQTRRVVKPQPKIQFGCKQIVLVLDPFHDDVFAGTTAAGMGTKGPRELQWHCEDFSGNLVARIDLRCPYGQPGEQLWVKETFGIHRDMSERPMSELGVGWVSYKADGKGCPETLIDRWRPSIFMPRWASRITLEITGIRVERLQDITEEDAMAEGVDWKDRAGLARFTARKLYAILWESLNAKKHSWSSNPWVWVISFKRL